MAEPYNGAESLDSAQSPSEYCPLSERLGDARPFVNRTSAGATSARMFSRRATTLGDRAIAAFRSPLSAVGRALFSSGPYQQEYSGARTEQCTSFKSRGAFRH